MRLVHRRKIHLAPLRGLVFIVERTMVDVHGIIAYNIVVEAIALCYVLSERHRRSTTDSSEIGRGSMLGGEREGTLIKLRWKLMECSGRRLVRGVSG